MSLVDVLANPDSKRAVVADSVVLLESEVASKRGLSGAAIRAGFKTMKKVKPGILAQAVDGLLPRFAPAVDPHFARARRNGDVRRWFTSHAEEIADDLLAVTDRRADKARNRVLVRVYKSLRPQARKHVVAAMPGVADLCDKHVPADVS